MKKLGRSIKNTFKWLFDWEDWKLLFRSIPSIVIALFVLSVVLMNILANRELVNWVWVTDGPFAGIGLGLDCGFTVSWVSFLFMDSICKRWGPKASTKVSLFALFVNLVVTGIFALLMLSPGNWGAAYNTPDFMDVANKALNSTLSGTWYVVVGSSVAMAVSAVVNSVINWVIGKAMKDKEEEISFKKFAARSFISTGIAQFVDNLVFAMLVSMIFFGWTWWQVVICSLVGALFELLCEVVLSPIAFKMVRAWKKDNVGNEYLNYLIANGRGNEINL